MPECSGGSKFADFLEEVVMAVEEKREARCKGVNVHSLRHGRLNIGQCVGQGEGQFLDGR